MHRNWSQIEPFDLEIERTLRAIRRRKKLEQEEQVLTMAEHAIEARQEQRALRDFAMPNASGIQTSIMPKGVTYSLKNPSVN